MTFDSINVCTYVHVVSKYRFGSYVVIKNIDLKFWTQKPRYTSLPVSP